MGRPDPKDLYDINANYGLSGREECLSCLVEIGWLNNGLEMVVFARTG